MTASNSSLFERAVRVIPGGVNSPVRAFGSVGGTPYFVQSGDGPYIWDAEGRRYIDYVQSYGSGILGHAHVQKGENGVECKYDPGSAFNWSRLKKAFDPH